jgi:Ribosomal protein S12/S23
MERSISVMGGADDRVTSFVPNDGCLNFIDENDGTLMVS